MPQTQKQMRGKEFKQDKAGKIACELLKYNEQISTAMEMRLDAEVRLVEVLRAQGRERLKIEDPKTGDGYLFTLNSIAAKEKISIKKDKVVNLAER